MKTNLLLVIALGMLSASLVRSEEPDAIRVPDRAATITVTPMTSPLVDNIERLMRMGEYERAADLAAMYLDKEPGNLELKSLLATCLEEGKSYDRLVAFMEQRLVDEPRSFNLLRLAGRAHLLAGDIDSARVLFYLAVGFANNRETPLAMIATHYQNHGLYDLAAEFIDSARIMANNPDLMPYQKGDALIALKRYGEAAIEYLNFMERDSVSAVQGERRLISMIEYPESADTVMAVLSGRISNRVDSRSLAVTYGRLLIEQSKFEEARQFFQEIDSLREHRGSDILYFIRECNRHGQYEQALLAGQYMLDKYPDSPWYGSIQFAMAEAYTAMGRYQDALALYIKVADELNRSSQKSEAYLRIGLIYKDYLKELTNARDYFNRIMAETPGSRYDSQARFGLADILVKEGKLDSAAVLYESFLTQNPTDDVAEQVEFILGRIGVFGGDFENADTRFRQIIGRYPRGLYVNDAIQYALLISEASSSAKAHMDLFSASDYYLYIDQEDSLEYYLTKICKVKIPALAPISYLRLAELNFERGDCEEALVAIDSLNDAFPESYFAPYGLKLKADILSQQADKRQEALDIYRGLLEKYPKYPFASKIRDLLRHLTETEQT